MILRRLRLHPFAAAADQTLELAPGLNVVVGPNEAGKTTYFEALAHVLFTDAGLKGDRFKRTLQRYLPIGGGDAIRVELSFSHGTPAYTLTRRWGVLPAAELRSPDGGLMADDGAIRQTIASMLGVSEGSCRAILMTKQSSLTGTLEAVRGEHAGSIEELSDMLRSAVMATGGVSVERFRAKLDEEHDALFSNWEVEKGRPKNARGIENPWQKKVGAVLARYYARETARRDLDEARKAEDDLAASNREIAEAVRLLQETEQFLSAHRKAFDDAGRLQILQAKRDTLRQALDDFRRVARDWPVQEEISRMTADQMAGLEKKAAELRAQRAEAEKDRKRRVLQEKHARVTERRSALRQVEEALAAAPKVTADMAKQVEAAASRVAQLKTKLTAGRLAVTLSSKKRIDISVESDFDGPRENCIDENQSKSFEAGGLLRIRHPEWTLEAASGARSLKEDRAELEKKSADLDRLLAEAGVALADRAREANRSYERALQEAKNARDNLAAELTGVSEEELDAAAREPAGPAGRPLEEITNECLGVETQLAELRARRNNADARIAEYEARFCAMDDLDGRREAAGADAKLLETEMAAMEKLPPGFDDAGAFIREYREKEISVGRVRDRKNAAEVKKAEIRMPEESAEDLARRLEQEQHAFETALRQGAALVRVREAAEAITAPTETETFAGLRREVADGLARITGGRYESVDFDRDVPGGLVRPDGRSVGAGLLSTGTLDALALAYRLAMSRAFLAGREGFIVMDDPLVDLDPQRQARAAALLREFAASTQVVIFTCHPAHAETLGGHTVRIGE